jgi:capsid protein
MIDPLKDAEADTMMMRNGTLTLREAIANRGFDPDTQIEEIAKTNALLDQHKIVLDSDARHDKKGEYAQYTAKAKDAAELTQSNKSE